MPNPRKYTQAYFYLYRAFTCQSLELIGNAVITMLNPAGCVLPQNPALTHGYKFWWCLNQYAQAALVRYGYRYLDTATVLQSCVENCDRMQPCVYRLPQ